MGILIKILAVSDGLSLKITVTPNQRIVLSWIIMISRGSLSLLMGTKINVLISVDFSTGEMQCFCHFK